MNPFGAKASRKKISEKITTAVASETPLRELAGSFSKVAKSALNEATTLKVEEIEISLVRLPKKLDGFKIIHLSDIHHSPFTDIKHIENTVKIANELNPDMFVLTGDYVSHEAEYVEPVGEILGGLVSEHGTFACLGNHDHWTDATGVTKSLRNNGIKVLINEGFRFTAKDVSFWLCGVDDHMVKQTDLKAALNGAFPDEMKMLLAHNPVIMRQAIKQNVDLIFSGHTHGGQVKIRDREKKILANRRKLTSGLHKRKDTQIYITRGIGTVVLPVRYQCPPEISLITLKANK